ncbi:uncharacterized protein VP01_4315g1, partial [Puccinia sorghi]
SEACTSQFKTSILHQTNFHQVHCLPEWLKALSEVQSELKECLELRETLDWNIGDEVWLSSRNISTIHTQTRKPTHQNPRTFLLSKNRP